MSEFLNKYKRTFTGFPSSVRDLFYAFADLGAAVLIVSLPLTFPIIYPAVQIFRKVTRK